VGTTRRSEATTKPSVPPVPGERKPATAQREQFGGVKWGSAFFGWLTATGTAVILAALAAATGTMLGLSSANGDVGQLRQAAQDPVTVQTTGVVGVIVVLMIVLAAYYCGGYVAGRMARFNGVRQGVAVWLWAVFFDVVVAVLAVIAGSGFNVVATLNGLPRLPIDVGDLTTAGIVTALLALATSLVGAILGGLAGMRFHRKIDRAGLMS